MRQAAPTEVQQFEHLVERRRVAPLWVDDREQPLQVTRDARRTRAASRARIQLRLPRNVLISPLCAMYRYGCASGHDGNVLVEKRLCTRAIALANLGSDRSGKNVRSWARREHALVDDRPRRKRRDVDAREPRARRAFSGRTRGGRSRALGPRACERSRDGCERPAPRTPARWRASPGGRRAEARRHRPGRRASRAPEASPAIARSAIRRRAFACVVGVLRQEDEARRIHVRPGQLEIHDPGEELVRDLDEDPCAVAGVFVCSLCSAVIEVLQSGDRLVHQPVGAPRREVGQKSDPAGVVLERRVVEAGRGALRARRIGSSHLQGASGCFLSRRRELVSCTRRLWGAW